MSRFGLLALLTALTQCVGSGAKENKWTAEDVVHTASASGFQMSPDGTHVVWVKASPNKEKGERVSHLMLTDLSDMETIELTRGEDDCTEPKWSPDGKRIAFLSARPSPKSADDKRSARRKERNKNGEDAKTQIWLINPRGGEPWRLTDFSRDVAHYDWAGADSLLFAAQEEKTQYETVIDDDKKDTSQVVEDERHEPPVRLFRIEVAGKKITRLTENTDRIDLLAVSPDGKHVVARHNRSLSFEYDGRIKPTMRLHDLEAGDSKQIFEGKNFNINAVRWLTDGTGFLAVNEFSSHQNGYPGILEVHHFDLKSDRETMVDLKWERGLGNQEANGSEVGLVPIEHGFLALLVDGVLNRVARYTRDGSTWKKEMLNGEHVDHVFGIAARSAKSIVFSHSTASAPGEWYHAPVSGMKVGEAKAITSLHEKFDGLPIAKREIIRWKGALDEEVEGILYYPHDYEEGKRYPLVIMIHGGPAYADPDMWEESWAYAPNLYCQRNAFVLKPNYHGSSNYGQKWVESITRGKYYDLEAPDIEKGIDHLIARGLVDKEKLGLLGWSNGAILTIELTTRSTRYKAAVSGAGDVDWVSDWGNCDFGESFDRVYLGKSLFEDPQLYIRKSPFYRLDKVRTPTLIFFGSEDRAVATQQGWMHFRALQQLKKTDVRFILFPGEKHSPTKLAHQQRKLEEELAWFDKYLFGTTMEVNSSIKKDSPLWSRLKLADAARAQGTFGYLFKEKVLPEVVAHGDLEIGRFEVTRAQFQSFRSDYPAGPLAADYPATGVTFADATAYCEWLSKLSGEKYRLPTEDEAKDLYDDSDGENTLDHWAGYAVNPDDAKRLRLKLDQLVVDGPLWSGGQKSAPLLKPVGQFKAIGTSGVYDLGGNAAEWVSDKGGKGILKGGSADQPADTKAIANDAAPGYQGFRVVRDRQPKK